MAKEDIDFQKYILNIVEYFACATHSRTSTIMQQSSVVYYCHHGHL